MYKNNFDFLRLLFAVFVIIAHSFVLTGNTPGDWVFILSQKQMTFSHIGVAGFFAISGYLVTQSLSRSNTLKVYYLKRVLRIYPALLVMLILTALLGPFFYKGSVLNYLGNASAWTYVPFNLLLFKLQYGISGIFENNIYPSVINGSLHTIPYEVALYISLSALFFYKREKQRIFMLVIAFCSLMLIKVLLSAQLYKQAPTNINLVIDYSGFFLIGALLSLFKIERIKYRNLGFTIAIAFWAITIWLNVYVWFQYYVLPLTVILAGTSSTAVINNIGNRVGDISYGLYIYAFPVQQALVHFFNMKSIPLMIIGTLVTLPFAYFSWHIIEKRALKMKRQFI